MQYRSHTIGPMLPGNDAVLFRRFSYAPPARRRTAQASRPAIEGWKGGAKRLLDIVIAMAILLTCALPILAIAIAIKLDSPGPVLFRQQRVGLRNRPFAMLKFRTMRHHRPSATDCRQATRDDPRITRLGHILRCSSLDELPQILNVLHGEMSIVGPRPHAPGTRAGGRLFEEVSGRYADRHTVRPGMTGLAQVRGWRGETDTEDKLLRRLDSDLEYIATWGLRLDLLIIWRTIFAVARMRNAY